MKRRDEILSHLKATAEPARVRGMARFGINPDMTLGVSVPDLRRVAGDVGTDHRLALALWASGIHEARILAAMVDDPAAVTEAQMDRWVEEFDSWDVCDQVCSNLFDKTRHAYRKALAWSKRKEEFVKRAGFVLMAALAVHDKSAKDAEFVRFLPVIARQADDERNFVKKAINWALRQIGKRNAVLNHAAIQTGHRIQAMESKSARWVAADALRELKSARVQKKLGVSH